MNSPRLLRGLVAAVAAAMLVPLTAAPSAAADSAAPPPVSKKIHPRLAKQLDTADAVSFWVRFDNRADLGAAERTRDWTRRGEQVVDALRQAAATGQRSVRAELDAAHVGYESFWATNAVYVDKGSKSLAERLAAESEVAGLYATSSFDLPRPTVDTGTDTDTDPVEWGVAAINADDVWQQRDARGEGIVVANIDSGVQYDHPALAAAYRGRSGDAVDHDHNWYDPTGTCATAPCDDNGHGTHTMGTMVGDGGPGSRIGVAPKARWMAAKGCTQSGCSDLALVKSGQWLLAPTDLGGQNPRPDLRPNVVNNSWGGDNGPEENPFFDDVIQAWTASGIFNAFAVGNAGPACDTAGSPGDSTHSYAVGAFGSDGTIASFSSRGPGAGGAAKPDIAAPGVDIRSSVPGGGYATADGTSMATPHLAGAVALLWSAAPQLTGDIPATLALLDSTAADVADTSCGGTAGDNSVWGQGKLDILAAVQAGPAADAGELLGTVTDSATGKPLGGAVVVAEGPVKRSLTTTSDGRYRAYLDVGSYTVTVSKYGYRGRTLTDVVIAKGEQRAGDVALEPVPMATLSGTVTDGSGHGWPVYAAITVDGRPGGPVYTDPYTGRYSVDVPQSAVHTLRVSARYPGYLDTNRSVAVDTADTTQDLTLGVDSAACTAPGYRAVHTGTTQSFDDPVTPEGWTVTDRTTGGGWRFDNPGKRTNLTGGGGGFAIVDGLYYGSGKTQDSTLTGPPVDMRGVERPELVFDTKHNTYGSAFAEVEYTADGGQSWTRIWRQTTTAVQGHVVIPIPAVADEPAVQVRFRYSGSFGFWWQLDNVSLGARDCAAADGGLVAGHVLDRNTGDPVNGARVSADGTSVVSAGTAADPGLDDGFFWMYAPTAGSRQITAVKSHYTDDAHTVDVAAHGVTRADFRLAIGRIAITPGAVEARTAWGGSATADLTVTNTGSAPAAVELSEHRRGFDVLAQQGAALNRVRTEVSPLAPEAADLTTTGPVTPSAAPWQSIADLPTAIQDNAVWRSGGRVYSGFGTTGTAYPRSLYAFDPATGRWTRLADASAERAAPAYGQIDGRFYAVGGWDSDHGIDPTVEIYNPRTDTWSTGAPAPKGWAASGHAVLEGRLYTVGGCAGSCGSTDVFAYDAGEDTWARLADYPEPVSWVNCGGIDGKVYCSGGIGTATESVRHTYAYDPATDAWTRKADLPVGLWGASADAAGGRLLVSGGAVNVTQVTNEGYAYDPAADSWSALPNANHSLYRSGGVCGFYRIGGSPSLLSYPWGLSQVLPGADRCETSGGVGWLALDATRLTLQPGESATVTVSMDAAAAMLTQPGALLAALGVTTDTPYATRSVPVTLTVLPPAGWGKVTGLVTGSGGDPVRGATVQVTGRLTRHTLVTGKDGRYDLWLDQSENPLTLIAAAPGYQLETARTKVKKGDAVTVDFTLIPTG